MGTVASVQAGAECEPEPKPNVEIDEEALKEWIASNPNEFKQLLSRHITSDILLSVIKSKDLLQGSDIINESGDLDISTIPSFGTEEGQQEPPEVTPLYSEYELAVFQDMTIPAVASKTLMHLMNVIECEGCTMYVHNKPEGCFTAFFIKDGCLHSKTCPLDEGIVSLVFSDAVSKVIPKAAQEALFVASTDNVVGLDAVQNAMFFPLSVGDETIGVLGMFNHDNADGFLEEHRSLASKKVRLASVALRNALKVNVLESKNAAYCDTAITASINCTRAQEDNKNAQTLMALARKVFFEDDVKEVMRSIITSARDLISADKCSLFLVDAETEELYSSVFDGYQIGQSEKEVRFPMSKGIAGHVATHKTVLNIKDAYEDERFNKSVDLETGYRTKSMLVIPLSNGQEVVGVATLINKKDSPDGFSQENEELFKKFGTFCGLCLHKVMLLEETHRKQHQLEVTVEMLSYHSQAPEEEAKTLSEYEIPGDAEYGEYSLCSYDFDPHCSTEDHLVHMILRMFSNLELDSEFKVRRLPLCRFILSVQKNYRPVEYHNFWHAVAVTQAFYVLAKNSTSFHKYFDSYEIFGFFIACLCHDVDHRGTNNTFQQQAKTPLAEIYSTSTMERHHFNHTLTILNSPGHQIFDHLPEKDHKRVLEVVEKGIIATDLALFFKNKGRYREIVDGGGFDATNQEHRDCLLRIIMPACDLSSATKPWKYSRVTAESVYAEFFSQGDTEKQLGITSQPLMDRGNITKLPKMQVGFIQYVVTPVYGFLCSALPETKPMVEGNAMNKLEWEKLLADNPPE